MAESSRLVTCEVVRPVEPPSRPRVPDPCAVVLFGATGDLTHRKLMPALFRLFQEGLLPERYAVVGFARRDWTDDRFRDAMRQTLADQIAAGFDDGWPQFAEHLAFAPGTFDEPNAYENLKATLDRLDASHGTQGNRLYYLASGPEFFATIVEHLGRAGLIYPAQQESLWSRVVIEKPFGRDLSSAHRLNLDVSRVLDERQVYRIDHYLGKETVQNILALRFGNAIFEPVWNRRHVASVQITVAEAIGMTGRRGAFYDATGALRDMVQNHMMQLLCLVAMEPPVTLDADAVRNEKVKVLQALPCWGPDDVARHVVRGQYTDGETGPSYHQETGVAPNSTTETYVALRLTLDTWRWAGVPFYLRTGKRLPKRVTEIVVQFHRPPTALFELDRRDNGQGANQLVLHIQPDEGASLAFQVKVPGARRQLEEVRMDFRYGSAFAAPPPEAYQRLLLDVMLGDPTLFTRTDEVENAWRFITTILDAWRHHGDPPRPYPAGTWGPSATDHLLAPDGARWRHP